MPRPSRVFGSKPEGTDPVDSANVRQAFLAYIGWKSEREALAAIGWTPKRFPHWLSDGNIPWYWRKKMWEYIGDKP